MNAELYERVLAEGGLINLSARAKWRLSGADRIRYLNGQVTNDVRRVESGAALYACVTNLKGRIEGDVFIHPENDSLLIDAEPNLRESLGTRLERYIIADDAVLEDITEDRQLWHAFGRAADALLAAGQHSPVVIRCQRLGIAGADLWLGADSPPPAITAPLLSADDFETLRVLQRVPRHPNELNADTFPQEAALEGSAMSFTKGCYIGQEILSRIKTTGKMPRQLVSWEGVQGDVSLGDQLFAATPEGSTRAVGVVTSVTRHPVRHSLVGLGFIRQGNADPDSVLLVGGDVPRIDATAKISPVANQ